MPPAGAALGSRVQANVIRETTEAFETTKERSAP